MGFDSEEFSSFLNGNGITIFLNPFQKPMSELLIEHMNFIWMLTFELNFSDLL